MKSRSHLADGMLAAVSGLTLALALFLSGAVQGIEGMSFDALARLFGSEGGRSSGPRVAVIYLDQSSLDWAGTELAVTWPWPREMYSLVAEFCAPAKTMTFDVLFSETSSFGVDDDLTFAAAIRKAGNTVLPAVLGAGTEASPPVLHLPTPAIAEAGSALGNVALSSDADGVFRHYPPARLHNGTMLPSLGLAAYLRGLPAAQNAAGFAVGPRSLEIGGADGVARTVRLDGRGMAIPRFTKSEIAFSRFNAGEIIASALAMRRGEKPQVDPAVLAGKYVFFGFSAPGLYDRQSTPVEASSPGVDIHATFLANLLDSSFISVIPRWLTILAMALFSAATGLTLTALRKIPSQAAADAVFVALPVLAGIASYAAGWWFAIVPVELAVLFSLIGAGIINFEREGRQKNFIKNAFRQYLSPQVIEGIIAKPELLRLGGERRVVSVMFTDLAGFTGLAEKLDPERLTLVLNEYLSVMSDIIFEEGGTIDKYEGDAIIAFWNAPLDQSDHASRAVRAAMRCRTALKSIKPRLAGLVRDAVGNEPVDFRMRIGINTGQVVVGNMGSRLRFNYTIIGDAVNLASRLEGANKEFGTSILVSRPTLEEAIHACPPACHTRMIARIAVVGRREAVDVFELPEDSDYEANADLFSMFDRGVELFRAGEFAGAATCFEPNSKSDSPSAAYLRRCRAYMLAPPESWDGVWEMSSK